jgi:F-type H+-transporting ATPase subunit a
MAAGLHISISAEPIFEIGGVSITNSIFTTWLVSGILLFYVVWFFSKIKNVSYEKKPSRLQALNEMIIEGLYNLVKTTAGTSKKARAFFPLVATFFIFIILANWSGLLPGFGTIGFIESHEVEEVQAQESVAGEMVVDEHSEVAIVDEADDHPAKEGSFVPYFRGPTADLNTTLALALFSIVMVQFTGFKFLGINYGSKFVNLKSPIDFFVGILEIFSEVSRIISFAFRLFGNVFAGEVLLAVMGFIMPLLAPLPFLGLEIFVGFIQALVFSMLTLVFLNIATISHSEEH